MATHQMIPGPEGNARKAMYALVGVPTLGADVFGAFTTIHAIQSHDANLLPYAVGLDFVFAGVTALLILSYTKTKPSRRMRITVGSDMPPQDIHRIQSRPSRNRRDQHNGHH